MRPDLRGLLPALLTLCAALPAQDPAPEAKDPAQEAQTRPAADPIALEKDGKPAEALAAWKQRAADAPDAVEPRREALRLLVQTGAVEEALGFGEEAVERFAKDGRLMAELAKAYLRMAELVAAGKGGDRDLRETLEDAEIQAFSALEVLPDDLDAMTVQAMALHHLGRLDAAEEAARKLMEKHPAHPAGALLVGEVLFRRYELAARDGDVPEEERFNILGRARQAFTEAARRDPARFQPYRRLGDLSWFQGDKNQCYKWYAQALARDPVRGAPLDWIRTQVPAMARVTLFQEAADERAKLAPDDARSRAALLYDAGLAANAVPNPKLCAEAMEAAFRGDEALVDALYYAGMSRYDLEEWEKARVAISEYSRRAWARLAETMRGATKEQAAALSDKLLYLAGSAYKARDLGGSREIQHALAAFHDTADRWNDYAFLCRETGLYEESYAGYRKALDKSPDDPNLLNDCALILQYHLRRDLDDARAMYEKAIANAKAIVKDRKADEGAKARARQAISDASGNLAKLPRERRR
ncbi:MAG: hypothetical protein R3F30_01605 [Planctomycetota bacterium]